MSPIYLNIKFKRCLGCRSAVSNSKLKSIFRTLKLFEDSHSASFEFKMVFEYLISNFPQISFYLISRFWKKVLTQIKSENIQSTKNLVKDLNLIAFLRKKFDMLDFDSELCKKIFKGRRENLESLGIEAYFRKLSSLIKNNTNCIPLFWNKKRVEIKSILESREKLVSRHESLERDLIFLFYFSFEILKLVQSELSDLLLPCLSQKISQKFALSPSKTFGLTISQLNIFERILGQDLLRFNRGKAPRMRLNFKDDSDLFIGYYHLAKRGFMNHQGREGLAFQIFENIFNQNSVSQKIEKWNRYMLQSQKIDTQMERRFDLELGMMRSYVLGQGPNSLSNISKRKEANETACLTKEMLTTSKNSKANNRKLKNDSDSESEDLSIVKLISKNPKIDFRKVLKKRSYQNSIFEGSKNSRNVLNKRKNVRFKEDLVNVKEYATSKPLDKAKRVKLSKKGLKPKPKQKTNKFTRNYRKTLSSKLQKDKREKNNDSKIEESNEAESESEESEDIFKANTKHISNLFGG